MIKKKRRRRRNLRERKRKERRQGSAWYEIVSNEKKILLIHPWEIEREREEKKRTWISIYKRRKR